MDVRPTIDSVKPLLKVKAFYAILLASIVFVITISIGVSGGIESIGAGWVTVNVILLLYSALFVYAYNSAEKRMVHIRDANFMTLIDGRFELRRNRYFKSISIADVKRVQYGYPYVRFVFYGISLDVKEDLEIFNEKDVDEFMVQLQSMIVNKKNA